LPRDDSRVAVVGRRPRQGVPLWLIVRPRFRYGTVSRRGFAREHPAGTRRGGRRVPDAAYALRVRQGAAVALLFAAGDLYIQQRCS